jgi:hypothetical protein
MVYSDEEYLLEDLFQLNIDFYQDMLAKTKQDSLTLFFFI